MLSQFPIANKLTGASEGGFVIDNGGPTNYGVTIPFLTDYWQHLGIFGTPTEKDIRNLTKADAVAAYEVLIWDKLSCGDMPAGVGYAFFDAAVNSGNHQASVWLQQSLCLLVDGHIGPKTIAAVQAAYAPLVITALSKARSKLMLGMNNAVEEENEKGWHIRLIDVTANAILMYTGNLEIGHV